MKAFVINLDDRTDRWESFQERWKNCQTIQFERYSAIRDTPGWKGLCRTHQEIVRQNLHEESILIIEDDATCEANFDQEFTYYLNWLSQRKWDLFYGGFTFPKDLNKTDDERIIQGKFLTAHFLLINSSMYQIILNYENLHPIDSFYMEHFGYAPVKMLSKQISTFSDIEKRNVNYDRFFNEASCQVLKLFKEKKYRWYNLFQPSETITFSSFDAFEYKFPHAKRFIEIAESISTDVNIIKFLPKTTDWIFADQYMLEHANLYARDTECKFVAVLFNDSIIPSYANIVILTNDQIIYRRDILTVITSYYKITNEKRRIEIETAILSNLNNPLVKEVILLCEHLPSFVHQKLKIIPVKSQPNYYDYFQVANTVYGLVMITNSDISLQNTELSLVPKYKEIFCLTRHEIDGSCPMIDNYNKIISHDSFIFWAPLKIKNGHFYYPQNVWGSENMTMIYLKEMGYTLLNPCKQIKIIHHHEIDDRPSDRMTINEGKYVAVYPY